MRLVLMVFHNFQKYIDDEQNDDVDEFVKTTSSKTRRRSKTTGS